MSIVLKNNEIKLEIAQPGVNYRGSRFDWSGQIVQITLKNKYTFCTTESKDPRTMDTLGRALYNEFGISAPVGYDECPVGENFHKIGTGLVLRDSHEPYNFYKPAAVTPLVYRVESSEQSAKFTVSAPKVRGYAYNLVKIITLCGSSFSIWYELTNTGDKKIQTDEYVHNFLSINNRDLDSCYELQFMHTLRPEDFGESVNPENLVEIQDHSVTWKAPLKEQFFFSNLNSGRRTRTGWKLLNSTAGAGISESSLFEAYKVNLWGNVHVVSPEIFFSINLAPGENVSWQRNYEIFEL